VKETQNWIGLLRDHAEKLSFRTLERLNSLITEKKAARKFYLDEKLRLDAELRKVIAILHQPLNPLSTY